MKLTEQIETKLKETFLAKHSDKLTGSTLQKARETIKELQKWAASIGRRLYHDDDNVRYIDGDEVIVMVGLKPEEAKELIKSSGAKLEGTGDKAHPAHDYKLEASGFDFPIVISLGKKSGVLSYIRTKFKK